MTEPKIIAIIGSTGFLGPYITASLLQKHAHAKIFCLNRSKDGEQRTISALQQISSNSLTTRNCLQFTTTDITQSNLGLNDKQYKHFTTEVDEIVFNAWNANWAMPLTKFEPLLNAVRNIIKACTASPKKPRITFISSNCSIMNWPSRHPEQPLIPEEPAWEDASAADSGYGQSKCIAEQLLARANLDSAVRVRIVRAGQISGPSSATAGSPGWPTQGWLYVTFKTSQQLGCWSVHMNATDWIPVDSLAEGITNITLTQPSNNDVVKVYNMMYPNPAPWALLYKVLTERYGLAVEEVTLPQWLGMLDHKTFKMHGFMTAAGEGREQEAMVFHNKNALEMLPKVENITAKQVEVWLKGWKLKLGETRARL
jgi:thioester reductase-like protein